MVITDAELFTIANRAVAATPDGVERAELTEDELLFHEHAHADVMALLAEVARVRDLLRAATDHATAKALTA